MFFKFPIEFEIPDDWWQASGMASFRVCAQAYPAGSDPQWPTTFVSFTQLIPPRRNEGVTQFVKDRMMAVLRGIAQRAILPPVPVHQPPNAAAGQLQLRDGFHRFYGAAAAGYTHMPVSVLPFFDIRNC
ncbi:MAG: hypothetical protein IT566_17140 [Rhodospirillaceae bacterium]|nr:hypothetical protein [Rhodospirillaceae bacterium]